MSKITWFFTLLIFTSNIWADTCETCNQNNGLAGEPVKAAAGVVKVEKVMKKLVDTNTNKKMDDKGFDKYCNEFYVSSNDKTIRPILSELKDKNFSVAEVFSTPACVPFKNNETQTLMPMFHYTAESPDNCVNYPRQLFEFFNKNQNPEGFTQVVNSKNKLGQTFLDYLKYRYDDEKSRGTLPEMEKKYIAIFNYVCSKGGVFTYYKNANCTSL